MQRAAIFVLPLAWLCGIATVHNAQSCNRNRNRNRNPTTAVMMPATWSLLLAAAMVAATFAGKCGGPQ